MRTLNVLEYYEDFDVGYTVSSLARTITEADVVNYCAISGNWNPMHCDAEYAKTTMFGTRLVQGALIYTIAVGLALKSPDAMGKVIANYGLEKMRFKAPVFIGDTVRVEMSLEAKSEHPKGGMLSFRFNVLNQRQEICCYFTQTVIVEKAPG